MPSEDFCHWYAYSEVPLPQVPVEADCAEPILKVPDITGTTVLYGAPIFTVATEYAIPEVAPDEIELVT